MSTVGIEKCNGPQYCGARATEPASPSASCQKRKTRNQNSPITGRDSSQQALIVSTEAQATRKSLVPNSIFANAR